jgi:hypothetical protein
VRSSRVSTWKTEHRCLCALRARQLLGSLSLVKRRASGRCMLRRCPDQLRISSAGSWQPRFFDAQPGRSCRPRRFRRNQARTHCSWQVAPLRPSVVVQGALAHQSATSASAMACQSGWRARCGRRWMPWHYTRAWPKSLVLLRRLTSTRPPLRPPTRSSTTAFSARARAAAGAANLGEHSLQRLGHRAMAPSTRFERKAQLSPGPR